MNSGEAREILMDEVMGMAERTGIFDHVPLAGPGAENIRRNFECRGDVSEYPAIWQAAEGIGGKAMLVIPVTIESAEALSGTALDAAALAKAGAFVLLNQADILMDLGDGEGLSFDRLRWIDYKSAQERPDEAAGDIDSAIRALGREPDFAEMHDGEHGNALISLSARDIDGEAIVALAVELDYPGLFDWPETGPETDLLKIAERMPGKPLEELDGAELKALIGSLEREMFPKAEERPKPKAGQRM